MSKQTKVTKQGSLSNAFKNAAGGDQEGALAYMLLAAFGVTLQQLMDIAMRMFASNDAKGIMLALTAAVQIRAHVVFVGSEYGGFKKKYPELVIEGTRDQADIFNFGALHALGHVLAHVTKHQLGQKILAKAGSCITGSNTTESEAGLINKEIFESWTGADKNSFGTWRDSLTVANINVLDTVVGGVDKKASAFGKKLNPQTGGGQVEESTPKQGSTA